MGAENDFCCCFFLSRKLSNSRLAWPPRMALSLPDDAGAALDWRLNVMQALLLKGCTDLQARQTAAEEVVRRAITRWRYQDELCALRALDKNRQWEKLQRGGLLALMPLRRVSARAALGQLHDVTQPLTIADNHNRHQQLRRGVRCLRRFWLAAAARAVSAPPLTSFCAFEERVDLRAMRAALGHWRWRVEVGTVLELARRVLRCGCCAHALGRMRDSAALHQAARNVVSLLGDRQSQLRMQAQPLWRAWARSALLRLRESIIRDNFSTRRLSSCWRTWEAGVAEQSALMRVIAMCTSRATRRQCHGAWVQWWYESRRRAELSASTSSGNKVVRRQRRRLLSGATASWWEAAATRRELHANEATVRELSQWRSRRLGFDALRAEALSDARLLSAWSQLGGGGLAAARASPPLFALWRRWLRRWCRARDVVGDYLQLLCRIGRSQAMRLLLQWRRTAEKASFDALRLALSSQTLTTRIIIIRLRAWCRRVRDERLRRSINYQQSVACAVMRVRSLWSVWSAMARVGAALDAKSADGAASLAERQRAALREGVYRLQAYADARRHMLLVRAGRSLLHSVRRWVARSNELSHSAFVLSTVRTRGRRLLMANALEAWCVAYSSQMDERSRHTMASGALLTLVFMRHAGMAFKAWQRNARLHQEFSFAAAAAMRRWRENSSALRSAAAASARLWSLSQPRGHVIRLCEAFECWVAPMESRNARASSYALLGQVRRRRMQAGGFGEWKYKAAMHNAHIIVVHRGRRVRREQAIDLWRDFTIFQAACFVVTLRHERRLYLEAMSTWMQTVTADAITAAILRKGAVPRWRRRCVTALRMWLSEATRRMHVLEARIRFRTAAAFGKLATRCSAASEFEGRRRLGTAITAHRLITAYLSEWHAIASALHAIRSLAGAAAAHFKHLAWHRWRGNVATKLVRDAERRRCDASCSAFFTPIAYKRALQLWAERADEWRGVVRPSQLLATMVRRATPRAPPHAYRA